MQREIYLGSKIGEWEVISEPITINGKRHRDLKCSCGNIQRASERNINRSTFSKNCRACSQKKRFLEEGNRTYFKGGKYGNFTVLDIDRTGSSAKYRVVCDCGAESTVTHSTLHKKSAGKSMLKCTHCFTQKDKSIKGSSFLTKNITLNKFKTQLRQANLRGVEFSIDAEYLEKIFNGKCSLSGKQIKIGTMIKRKGVMDNGTASLDRIDSNKGYIKGNLQWIYKPLNKMKIGMTDKEFVELCTLVSNYANQQPSH